VSELHEPPRQRDAGGAGADDAHVAWSRAASPCFAQIDQHGGRAARQAAAAALLRSGAFWSCHQQLNIVMA
jgi:hypothetical protein